MTKWVYSFGSGSAEGEATMRNLLGGKGANLAEMSNLGLPVPPGLTITTEVCAHYAENDETYPKGLKEEVDAVVEKVEKITGCIFGDPENPLLLSVRSGARVSMPGMMDTVLNLGLNDKTVKGLEKRSGDARFAYDSYRRFIQMYGNVVMGVELEHFEEILDQHKKKHGMEQDTELTGKIWQDVVKDYENLVEKDLGRPFPQDVRDQLWGAIGAVFGSWMVPRAVEYRRIHDIPGDWGTAVNVQAMVFGNMGDDCATGVAFTRNPSHGAKEFYGEFLINAQGEDVVAGIRTPNPLTNHAKNSNDSDLPSMEESMPDIFAQLNEVRNRLETHYHDMQDIEFTVQKHKLWMLQTRSGKRTAAAALKIAVDMEEEGLITKSEALQRVDPISLEQLLHPMIDPKAERNVISKGMPASPGAAHGAVMFTADAAEKHAAKEPVILVRVETSPDDIHGMNAAQGILTTRGGATSHAAVVARGMGRACVCSAQGIVIDTNAGSMRVQGMTIKKGDKITIDGGTGEVMLGEVATIEPKLSNDFTKIIEWADEIRRMKVRANAETPTDAKMARRYGAEGIGLCRTEHMFFDKERIIAVREMIMAEDEEGRRKALFKLLPMQRQDFIELFEIMDGLPVTIRLLDPPLHEFLPHSDEDISVFSKATGITPEAVAQHIERLKESNPMLGHRGCRLAITYPEISEMQARAIFEAIKKVTGVSGKAVDPEIMIPLVVDEKEFAILKDVIDSVAEEVFPDAATRPPYKVGTMIELPRAALCAGQIAETAEFFSFGTNDLTQTTFGLSRDDSGNFIPAYQRQGIFERDPFVSLDTDGVGELVSIAAERGRATRKDLKLGICGEHGGDPASISFCEKVDLDYVSCSPFRVPTARLAAAQAVLKKKDRKAG
ncbi:MAG TPA: pyruvate, phosphate dikinase [Alphaproteobacteria bacterium]|nr:pyruvate, phosphate dikinase [Alphaproteobacteria bacterium]